MSVLLISLVGALSLVLCTCRHTTCPFRRCDNSRDLLLGRLDYEACVKELKVSQQCIQSAQNQSDICTKCSRKHEYNTYTHPDFIADKIAKYCYTKQCKVTELKTCTMRHKQAMMNVFLFQDTSNIDGVISCVDAWKPELDRTTCFNGLTQASLLGHEDPVELFKQMLQEIRDGCDVLLPLAECRKHLAPLGVPIFRRRSPRERASLTSAVEATINCVLSAFAKYPCATIASQLAAEKDVMLKQVAKVLGKRQVNNYGKQCRGAPNS